MLVEIRFVKFFSENFFSQNFLFRKLFFEKNFLKKILKKNFPKKFLKKIQEKFSENNFPKKISKKILKKCFEKKFKQKIFSQKKVLKTKKFSEKSSTYVTKIKPTLTYFNPLQTTTPIYHLLFTTEINKPLIHLIVKEKERNSIKK